MKLTEKKMNEIIADMIHRDEITSVVMPRIFGRRSYEVQPLQKFWPSPIDIPEEQSGRIKIVHEMMTGELPIIGTRQAFLTGQRKSVLKLDKPVRIHKLEDDNNGVWMTDMPEELHQIVSMIESIKPEGKVLVGGLGLGALCHFLARHKSVKLISVVENSPDVINLVAPYLPSPCVVWQDDIAQFLRTADEVYDYYLLDTWQSTSENTWWSEVMPLRRIIRNKFGIKPTIHCWAEDIMGGQVVNALASKLKNDWMYRGLAGMSAEEIVQFFTSVGTSTWEEKYGRIVDENMAN